MRRGVQVALIVTVAAVAVAAGYMVNAWWRADAHAAAGAALMKAQLTDLKGEPRVLDAWRGRVLVVNFWATWCAPCRDEIPVFIKLQRQHGGRGLQFIGIAIDQREKVEAFAQDFGINYPVLLGGLDAVEISRGAGNRLGALPFTVIIDRSGRLVGTQLGIIKEAKLQAIVEPML